MARALRHTDTTPGWINRRFARLERMIRESAAAKKLQAATIGKGGITVTDGGGITVKDNGAFSAQFPDGSESARFGPAHTLDGRVTQAMTVRHEDGNVVFGANRTPYDPAFPAYPDGQTAVQVGGFGQPVDSFSVEADTVSVTGGTGSILMDAVGNVTLIPGFGTGGYISFFVNTTGSGANAYIDAATGEIKRSTSSRRYKQDIADADVDPAAVLRMQPRTWRDKREVAADESTEKRYVGFIAEELHDLGLGQFVDYDEAGPESIQYDRLAVALLAAVKHLNERVTALEAQAAEH